MDVELKHVDASIRVLEGISNKEVSSSHLECLDYKKKLRTDMTRKTQSVPVPQPGKL